MKKLKAIIALVFALLILAGCTKADIKAGVTKDNAAFLEYQIEIDTVGLTDVESASVMDVMAEIAAYYRDELDFEVTLREDDAMVRLVMRRVDQQFSPDDAFDALKKMLEDERMTPFCRLDMRRTSTDMGSAYLIDAELDVSDIMSDEDIKRMPYESRVKLEQALKEMSGNVTVNLGDNQSSDTFTLRKSAHLRLEYSRDSIKGWIARGFEGTQWVFILATVLLGMLGAGALVIYILKNRRGR